MTDKEMVLMRKLWEAMWDSGLHPSRYTDEDGTESYGIQFGSTGFYINLRDIFGDDVIDILLTEDPR